jgi:apolipoprotein N-acyltransferase
LKSGSRKPVVRNNRRVAVKLSGQGLSTWLLPALASGLLLGIAYPPVDASWLVWVGLVPLLWAIRHEQRASRAFLMGTIAGTVMCLFALRPLVSAHLWSGWGSAEVANVATLRSRQFVVLNVLWAMWSVAIGCFWGAFALVLFRIARRSAARMAIAAPALVVLVPEWLRSLVAWHFHWAFLGNAAIDIEGVRQLGALGGVWLISWLIVTVNVAILALLSREKKPGRWILPAVTAAVMVLVLLGGSWRAGAVRSRMARAEGLRAAALQVHQPRYTFADFTPLGFERAYLQLMREVAQGKAGKVQLLVLPESIAYTVLSLDGSRTSAKPDSVHRSPEQWMESIRSAIGDSDPHFAVVLGLDTVELGALHNSLSFWTKSGLQAWYHKRRLVPFAEYRPALLGFFDVRGPTETNRVMQGVVTLNGIRVGGFICQELISAVTRRSTREGARSS